MMNDCFTAFQRDRWTEHIAGERCDADKYQQHAVDIARAIDAVSVALLNPAMKVHPELEREVEDQIASYGRYL